jgi:CheY-like chemotaxis protein
VHVIMDPLPRAEKATVWQQTDGKGWQQTHTDYDSSSPPSRPISREHEVSRERRQPMSTILVVDDSPTALKLVSKALATAGHHIIMASNGEEAVAKATDAHPDLVVLDVIMPHKNGYQVCRQLKNDAKTHDIKIILCTRQNQQADRFWGMQQGADAYLAKPFDEAELLATVARFLP